MRPLALLTLALPRDFNSFSSYSAWCATNGVPAAGGAANADTGATKAAMVSASEAAWRRETEDMRRMGFPWILELQQ
jgi:hypothetical protein